MKLEWEIIFNNEGKPSGAFHQETYRAKVIGGWIVRHITFTDYQYPDGRYDEESRQKYVHDEGYQGVTNNMLFISDPQHKWDEANNPMAGAI